MIRCNLAFVLVCVSAPALLAQPTYWQDVRPALRKHCIACHNVRTAGEVEVSGGLALDRYDSFMKNPRKPVIHPGKSAESELVKRVTSNDDTIRMPPSDTKLPAEVVVLLRRWIDGGALEGKKPDETETIIATPGPKRRKLPVTLLTSAIPPPSVLDTGKPDKLQLSLRIGPLSPITAVVFSPDGKLLATGCYGHVTLWDLANVRPVKVLTNVLGAVSDLRFSPDGTLLAVAGGQPSARGDLRLFEVNGWKLKTVLRGHEDTVSSVAFRPDGKKLVSASFDKSVRIWDLATFKAEAILEPHSDFVYAIAYSPDGKWLASASKDRTVKLIDADARQGKLTFSGMTLDVLAVAFSGNGQRVLSSGYEPALSWWDTKTAAREKSQPGHRGAVHEICVSKDGKLIASGGADASVILWDGSSGSSLRTLSAGSLVYAVALSPDSRLVAAGSFDGLVRLFDVKTGRQLATLLSVGSEDWLAQTPEGYTSGSKTLTATGEWLMAGRKAPAEKVWKALGQADVLSKSLRGETLPVPAFPK
jgi:WD40 repeat protein